MILGPELSAGERSGKISVLPAVRAQENKNQILVPLSSWPLLSSGHYPKSLSRSPHTAGGK